MVSVTVICTILSIECDLNCSLSEVIRLWCIASCSSRVENGSLAILAESDKVTVSRVGNVNFSIFWMERFEVLTSK